MSDEIKNEILTAWNRYRIDHQRRTKRNEASAVQHEDAIKRFKDGVLGHKSLSNKEKIEILSAVGMPA